MPNAKENFLATDGHSFRVLAVVEWLRTSSTQDVNPASLFHLGKACVLKRETHRSPPSAIFGKRRPRPKQTKRMINRRRNRKKSTPKTRTRKTHCLHSLHMQDP